MIILDTLFIICFGPFQKVKNGRSAAVIWLIQIIGSTLVAILNATFFILGINLSSVGIAVTGTLAGIVVYIVFNSIYVKNNREVGVVRYPFLMGILIFVLLMSSLLFMIFSLARY